MKNLNYKGPIEIAKEVYWIGYGIEKAIFQSNPYLIIDNNEAVLIDPGSIIDFPIIFKKFKKITDIQKIKYIILHHQDPDLCAAVPLIEKLIKHPIKIFAPARSSIFLRYYGIKSEVIPINKDKVSLKFGNQRVLEFYMTPYMHSPGAMVTYDKKNGILFSSDIFGAFDPKWELYVKNKETHVKHVKSFVEPYFGSKKAVLSAVEKFEELNIKMICPQHGSIIKDNINWWINKLKNMNFGLALKKEVKWW